MKISLQLFGGGGGPSGGTYSIHSHRMPDTGKPNSRMTRYDYKGIKRETRYYNSKGERMKDVHYTGSPNHQYPHEHYWWKDNYGAWHRTTYEDWVKGVRL